MFEQYCPCWLIEPSLNGLFFEFGTLRFVPPVDLLDLWPNATDAIPIIRTIKTTMAMSSHFGNLVFFNYLQAINS